MTRLGNVKSGKSECEMGESECESGGIGESRVPRRARAQGHAHWDQGVGFEAETRGLREREGAGCADHVTVFLCVLVKWQCLFAMET